MPRPLEKEKIEYFIKHYPTSFNDDLVNAMGISLSTIQKRASFMELKKNEEYKNRTIRPVVQLDYYTNEEIGYYPTMREAEKDNFVTKGTVSYAIRHNGGVLKKYEMKFKEIEVESSCEKESFRPKI